MRNIGFQVYGDIILQLIKKNFRNIFQKLERGIRILFQFLSQVMRDVD